MIDNCEQFLSSLFSAPELIFLKKILKKKIPGHWHWGENEKEA